MIAFAFLLLCVEISFNFADLDRKFGNDISTTILWHRSILTHNYLLPLAFYGLVLCRNGFWTRLYAIVIGIGNAVHLSFDLFPKAWQGFALIHIPFYGHTSPLFSQLWMVLSIIISLYIVFLLIRTSWDVAIVFAGIILLFGVYILQHEDESPNKPALGFLGSTAATLVLPDNPRRAGLRFHRKRIQPGISRRNAA